MANGAGKTGDRNLALAMEEIQERFGSAIFSTRPARSWGALTLLPPASAAVPSSGVF
jgi:hypothetical protein